MMYLNFNSFKKKSKNFNKHEKLREILSCFLFHDVKTILLFSAFYQNIAYVIFKSECCGFINKMIYSEIHVLHEQFWQTYHVLNF